MKDVEDGMLCVRTSVQSLREAMNAVGCQLPFVAVTSFPRSLLNASFALV